MFFYEGKPYLGIMTSNTQKQPAVNNLVLTFHVTYLVKKHWTEISNIPEIFYALLGVFLAYLNVKLLKKKACLQSFLSQTKYRE